MKTVHINAWTDCISILLRWVFSGPRIKDVEHKQYHASVVYGYITLLFLT